MLLAILTAAEPTANAKFRNVNVEIPPLVSGHKSWSLEFLFSGSGLYTCHALPDVSEGDLKIN